MKELAESDSVDNSTANGGRRSRRSAGVPAKYSSNEPTRQTRPGKRKAVQRDEAEGQNVLDQSPIASLSLDFILSEIKSPLTKVDISDVLNEKTWTSLSAQAREKLSRLLPPTAFPNFECNVDDIHPSRRHKATLAICTSTEQDAAPNTPPSSPLTELSSHSPASLCEPDLNFFTDPHFESAAHTFQDHLYSGWMTDSHRKLVQDYLQGVQEGSMHAPWKDQVWEEQHPRQTDIAPLSSSVSEPQTGTSAQAGDAAGFKLGDLAKSGLIKPGDILAYKRNFNVPGMEISVEKDALIQSIHPKTGNLTVLSVHGPTPSLPHQILDSRLDHSSFSSIHLLENTPDLREMTIVSPTQLEAALLDLDGRLERSKRPHGNAWKSVHVWRLPAGDDPLAVESSEPMEVDMQMASFSGERGMRTPYGTLFYLRGCL